MIHYVYVEHNSDTWQLMAQCMPSTAGNQQNF